MILRLSCLRSSPGPFGLPGRAMAYCDCADASVGLLLPSALAASEPVLLFVVRGTSRKGEGSGAISLYSAAVLLERRSRGFFWVPDPCPVQHASSTSVQAALRRGAGLWCPRLGRCQGKSRLNYRRDTFVAIGCATC